jgi:hypothetical protein
VTAQRRPPVLLLTAVALTLVANMVVWRRPTEPRPGRERRAGRVAARLPPPQWAAAPPGAPDLACARSVAERTGELGRLQADLLRRRPYQEHYQAAASNEAARRWLEGQLGSQLSTPPPGATVAAACRGEICRLEIQGPADQHRIESRWLSQVVARHDSALETGDQEALVRYVRVPVDEGADGNEILARFNAGYPWDGLRAACAREGPLPPLGVMVAIRQHDLGEPSFEVTLLDRRGHTRSETTPAEACVTWTVLQALARVELPPSATRAAVRHFLEAPATTQRQGS